MKVYSLLFLLFFLNFSFAEESSVELPYGDVNYSISGDTASFENTILSVAKPALAQQNVKFLLPPNVDKNSIHVYVENGIYDTVVTDCYVSPVVPPTIRGEIFYPDDIDVIDGKDVGVYEKNAFYPENSVSSYSLGKLNGYIVCEIEFLPYKYNPVSKTLVKIVSGSLKVEYSLGNSQNSLNTVKNFGAWKIDNEIRQKVNDLVVNKKDISKFYGSLPSLQGLNLTDLTQKTGYAIITTSAIADKSKKLQKFISLKSNQGYDVYLVKENEWLNGATTSDQRADNIRLWLQENYQSENIEYVLLIGNPNPSTGDVPMKMTYPRNNAKYSTQYKDAPTDFYYADLSGNWDLDGDGKYGEFRDDFSSDGADRFAEVVVGRIPYYGKIHDLDKILDKVIDYEKAPEESMKWRKNVLLPMKPSDAQTPGYQLAEAIKSDFLISNNYTSTRIYEQDYGKNPEIFPCNYTTVEDEWKHGKYGMVVWWTHGWQTGAVDIMTSSNSVKLNDSFPAFTYQVSCLNSYPEYSNNLTYSLLLNGGVATISGTRVTWYWRGQTKFAGTSTNSGMAYEYTKRVIEQGMPAGDAIQDMKETLPVNADYLWMNFLDMMLYGTPDISLKAKAPNTYISIKTPKQGDVFGTDDTIKISWRSLGPKYFIVEFSSDSSKTFKTISLTTDTSYNFIAPNIKSNGCVVKVSNIEGEESDLSGMFMINDTSITPKITVSVFDTTDEDHSLDVDIMGKIAENGFVDYKIVDNPHSGQIVRVGNFVTYVPDENFHGVDSFSYSFLDNNGHWSNKGWSLINVNSIDDAPMLTQSIPDVAVEENQSDSSINLSNYFYDPDDSSNMFYQVLTSNYLLYERFTGLSLNDYWSASKGVTENAAAINEISEPYSIEIPHSDSLIREFLPLKGYVSAKLSFNWEKQGTRLEAVEDGGPFSIYYYSIDGVWKFLKSYTSNEGAINQFIYEEIELPKDALHKACQLKIVNSSKSGSFFFDDIKVVGVNYSDIASVRSDGSLVLNPPSNWVGQKDIIVSALDKCGMSTFDTIHFKVNIAPVAENLEYNFMEDHYQAVAFHATDKDGVIKSYVVTDNPIYGTISYISTGNYKYLPYENFYGTDSIGYVAIDDNDISSKKAWVKLNVSPVNDSPYILSDSIFYAIEGLEFYKSIVVADPDNVVDVSLENMPGWLHYQNGVFSGIPNSFSRDTLMKIKATDHNLEVEKFINIKVQNKPVFVSNPLKEATQDIAYSYKAMAVDPNNDILSYSLLDAPSNMTIDNLGYISWTPTKEEALLDSVYVSISVHDDASHELSANQNFWIKVNNVNDAPYFVIKKNIDTLINPSQTIVKRFYAKDDDHDDIIFNVIGSADSASFVYGVDYIDFSFKSSTSGANFFAFTAKDKSGDSAMLTITVRVNNPPVVSDVSAEFQEDENSSITLSGNDIDGSISSYLVIDNGNGSVAHELTNKNLLYLNPKKDFNGFDTLKYVAVDNNGISSDAGNIFIKVNSVNDPPQIVNKLNFDAIERGVYSFAPEIYDPDDDPIVSYKDIPEWLTLSNNQISGTVPLDYNNFSFKVIADDGEFKDSAIINVNVCHYPKITSVPQLSTDQDDDYSYSILSTDIDGDDLSYSLLSGPLGMNLNSSMITWTSKNSDVKNSPFNVIYSVTDNSKYSLTVYDTFDLVVNNINDAPTFNPVAKKILELNQGDSIYNVYYATDIDDDELSFNTVYNPLNSKVYKFSKSIAFGYRATDKLKDSLIFVVSDGVLTDSLKIILNINKKPTAASLSYVIQEDNNKNIVLTGDDQDGVIKRYQVYNYVRHGSLYRVGNMVLYTPLLNYNGADSFSYRVLDNDNKWSDLAWVKIKIDPVNDAPKLVSPYTWTVTDQQEYYYNTRVYDPDNSTVLSFSSLPSWITRDGDNLIANADSLSVDTTVEIIAFDGLDKDTLDLFVDVQHQPKIISVADEIAYEDVEYSYHIEANDIDGDFLTYSLSRAPLGMTINPFTGLIKWMPTNSAAQLDSVRVDISVFDNGIPKLGDTQTFYIKVFNKNDKPRFYYARSYVRVTKGKVNHISYYVQDEDSKNLNFSILNGPEGAVSDFSSNVGTVTYIALQDDSLIVKVEDDSGAYSIFYTYISVNNPPVIMDVNDTIDEDTKTTITLNAYDADGIVAYYALKQAAKHGFITFLGKQIIYVPQYNYSGNDSILVVAYDAEGAVSNIGKVSILINSVNDSPRVVSPSLISVLEGEDIYYVPKIEDSDDIPELIVENLPSYLTYKDGVISGISTRTTLSSDFRLIATDGVLYDTMDVAVEIKHPPKIVSVPDTISIEDKEYSYAIDVDDPDDDSFVYTIKNGAEGMYISNGVLKWIPGDADVLAGKVSVVLSVADKDGLEDEQEFTINVINVNDAPVFNPLSSYLSEIEENKSFEISFYAKDVDSDTLTFSVTGAPYGSSILKGDDHVKLVVPSAGVGFYNIESIVSDGELNDTLIYQLEVSKTFVKKIINKNVDGYDIIVAPAPLIGDAKILIEQKQSGDVELELYDIYQRKVASEYIGFQLNKANITNSKIFDNLPKGIYFIVQKSNGVFVAIFRVVKLD